jgi:hypothetical protein
VHWRRGDFVSLSNDPRGRTPPSDMWQTPEDLIEAVKGLLERHNLDRVFLLTNEVRPRLSLPASDLIRLMRSAE